MADILTMTEACRLAEVLTATNGDAKVARYREDTGDVLYGTARAFTGPMGAPVDWQNADVRDLHLWVTLTTGFETWWPVRELMAEVTSGYFAPNYDGPTV